MSPSHNLELVRAADKIGVGENMVQELVSMYGDILAQLVLRWMTKKATDDRQFISKLAASDELGAPKPPPAPAVPPATPPPTIPTGSATPTAPAAHKDPAHKDPKDPPAHPSHPAPKDPKDQAAPPVQQVVKLELSGGLAQRFVSIMLKQYRAEILDFLHAQVDGIYDELLQRVEVRMAGVTSVPGSVRR